MVDQFFTPEHIATSILSKIGDKKFNVVADFAVGNGSLLKALPFRPKSVLGMDLDTKIISRLKKKHANWSLLKGDFLNPNGDAIKWLMKWVFKVDLILLNPPFSCKGGKRMDITINGQNFKCRTALAFVIKSLKYLKPNGMLVGILPLSCFKSEADKLIFSELGKVWEVSYGESFDSNSFVGCSSNSIVIILKKKNTHITHQLPISSSIKSKFNVEILRGSTQMHKTLSTGKFKVIHSTNLQQGIIKEPFRYSDNKKTFCDLGTYLLIPRVGQPKFHKVTLLTITKIHLLSDCVIALKAHDFQDLTLLKNLIYDNWEEFSCLYQSTCAPYITMNQILHFLTVNNVSCKIVNSFPRLKKTTGTKIDSSINSSLHIRAIKSDNNILNLSELELLTGT